jgi:hypothetical protein
MMRPAAVSRGKDRVVGFMVIFGEQLRSAYRQGQRNRNCFCCWASIKKKDNPNH